MFEEEFNQPARASILEARGIAKTYSKRTVVDHVSYSVRQGECVGLLGPNGAGKTTSFYMIVGMIQPSEGTIVLDGSDTVSYTHLTLPTFYSMNHLPELIQLQLKTLCTWFER